jgi:flagella basal body P-ring formation protein FlgA
MFRVVTFIAVLMLGSAHAGPGLTLRNDVESIGPAVTLDDVFEGAGQAGARAIAPAPRPGRTVQLSPAFVQAAARAAGLDWTAPAGLTAIEVRGPGAPATSSPTRSSAPARETVIKRGDLVTLVYTAPGLKLTARARAQTDAKQGEALRLINLSSNRTIDAVAIGPGAASASPSSQ